ncbi:MAG: phosphoserine phosphatase SerB [Arenicella sp.]|nr:phosphoserine phosphatase SerB [Arenicella sp.]
MSSFKQFSTALEQASKSSTIDELYFLGAPHTPQSMSINQLALEARSDDRTDNKGTSEILFLDQTCPVDAFALLAQKLGETNSELYSLKRKTITESPDLQAQCWVMNCSLAASDMDYKGLIAQTIDELERISSSGAEHLDIVLIDNPALHSTIKLACFDMDSTLIKMEVIDELARYAGIGDQVSQITERAMRGELDFKESFTARLGLLNGLRAEVIEEIKQSLPVMEGAVLLMAGLKRRGVVTMIFSGGFDVFAQHLAKSLGMQSFHANTLEVHDGVLTGAVHPPVVDADLKRALLRRYSGELRLSAEQTLAVGDGANDLKMLGAAGLGVAYRAKPIVRQQAQVAISKNDLSSILYLL